MDLPARVGRYDVVRLLGQGGMGRVLLAKDSVLGRNVALKLLRDDLGLPPELRDSLFARMRQEARAAAALEHPHMVTLHDMGEEAPHGLFLVFEYVQGPTLREVIASDGRITLDAATSMARELGDALTAAHEAGVIHRDVKPENIMLSKFGAKLTDFGIARMPDSTLTRAGSVLGTPAYSAPEALALAEFGPLSDQFSFAVTLYEAISGRRAFPGDDALMIATRIATEPAAPLPFTAADPRVVARIDQVLARAMNKDRTKRFASCRELGDAIAEAIEGRFAVELARTLETPVPRSIVPRATRRVQNLFAAAALLVIVALILLGRRESAQSGISMRHVAASFNSAIVSQRPPTPLPAPVAPVPKRTPLRDAGTDAAIVDASIEASASVVDVAIDDAGHD